MQYSLFHTSTLAQNSQTHTIHSNILKYLVQFSAHKANDLQIFFFIQIVIFIYSVAYQFLSRMEQKQLNNVKYLVRSECSHKVVFK